MAVLLVWLGVLKFVDLSGGPFPQHWSLLDFARPGERKGAGHIQGRIQGHNRL